MDVVSIALLLVAGFIFLALELFIVPGFSVPGIAGLALIGYGVFRAHGVYGFAGTMITLAVSIVVTIVAVSLALRSGTIRKFSLASSQTGTRAGDDYTVLAGRAGVALTTLRPAGTAKIDGSRVDVVTDGEYVDAGTPVRVIKVEGSRIVVAPGSSGQAVQ